MNQSEIQENNPGTFLFLSKKEHNLPARSRFGKGRNPSQNKEQHWLFARRPAPFPGQANAAPRIFWQSPPACTQTLQSKSLILRRP